MAIRISQTSKLRARSWSLQALDTCPGSIDTKNGGLVPACQGCYATDGNYRFKNVKAPRLENKEDWKRSGWVDDMVEELDADRYFRWFDSGDMYALELAEKILQVMERTPWVNHWLPTRMHKFPKFADVIRKMQALPNVSVRCSSDDVRGEYVAGVHGSTIIGADQIEDATAAGLFICRSFENDGKCGDCRQCWKKGGVIAYVQHGRKMKKVNDAAIIARG